MSDDNFSRKQRVTPNYEDLAEAKPKVASPQRAPTPITQTPEFIEAIARAKADIHAEIAPLIDALRQSKGEGQVEGDQMSFARQMAMAIAEIADGDQGRKRTPPEELAKRARARAQMDEAIARARRKADEYRAATGQARDPGPDAPEYLALGKSYLDETLVEPFEVDAATKRPYPVKFVWFSAPNEAMAPLNETAHEIFTHFKVSIGEKGPLPLSPSGYQESEKGQAWITAGGLVMMGMNGVPVSMQEHRGAPDPVALAANMFQRGPGQFDPRRDRINILGTVAEPARHVSTNEPRSP